MTKITVETSMGDGDRRKLERALQRNLRRAGLKPNTSGIRKATKNIQKKLNGK